MRAVVFCLIKWWKYAANNDEGLFSIRNSFCLEREIIYHIVIYMIFVHRIEETAAEREERIKKWNEFLETEATNSK